MYLETVDKLIELAHGNKRSIECVIFGKFNVLPKNLEESSKKAQNIFPKTGKFPIIISSFSDPQHFINQTLPTPFHLELAINTDGEFGFKMSHLLGDAISMILWLKAFSDSHETIFQNEIRFKKLPNKKKDTPYRKIIPSRVWPRNTHDISNKREIILKKMEHPNPKSIRLNDIFILSLLKSLSLKNSSLWIPINSRADFFQGFGNGLARMRIYPPKENNLKDQLLNIRKQKSENLINGEVSLPPENLSLDSFFQKKLITLWLKRPWADWASMSFSHLSDRDDFFNSFQNLWGVSNIMPKHNAALFALTKGQETQFCLSYDPTQVNKIEGNRLLDEMIQSSKDMIHEIMA